MTNRVYAQVVQIHEVFTSIHKIDLDQNHLGTHEFSLTDDYDKIAQKVLKIYKQSSEVEYLVTKDHLQFYKKDYQILTKNDYLTKPEFSDYNTYH